MEAASPESSHAAEWLRAPFGCRQCCGPRVTTAAARLPRRKEVATRDVTNPAGSHSLTLRDCWPLLCALVAAEQYGPGQLFQLV